MSALNGVDNDDEKIFKKSVKFFVKNLPANVSRTADLSLSLEWLSRNATMHKKELVLAVADEEDPFFLYTLNLDNEEYTRLKHQQGLLVDFISFPGSFMDLIELCIQDEDNSSPKYALNLTLDVKSSCSFAQLEIVEVNRFKMITHLSLRLCSPSDAQLKQYLAECFRKIKGERDNIRSRHEVLEKEYSVRSQNYRESMRLKYEEMSNTYNVMLSDMEKKLKKQREDHEKEKQHLRAQWEDDKQKMEVEYRGKESNYLKEIKELESRALSSENLVKELNEKISRLEKVKCEYHSKIKSLEKELNDLKKHQELFDLQNEGLELEVKQAEEKIKTLECDCQTLQQESAAKDQEILHLKNDLENVESEKFRMLEDLREMEDIIETNRNKQNGLCCDIAKANDIIRKMQADLRITHEKLKARTLLVTQLDQLIKEKDNHVQSLEKEIAHLHFAIREMEKKFMELENSNKDLKIELIVCKKKLTDNENDDHRLTMLNDNNATGKASGSEDGNADNHSGNKLRTLVPVSSDNALDPKYLQRNNHLYDGEAAGGDLNGESSHGHQEELPKSFQPVQSVRPKRGGSRISQGKLTRTAKQFPELSAECPQQRQQQTESTQTNIHSKPGQIQRR